MPELPEVERGRKLAEAALVGRTIAAVATVNDAIVYAGVSPRRFAWALRNRRVTAVGRRGKHLWFELDRRPWPTFHFGMTGRFEVYQARRDRPRFWKVELLADDGRRLAMTNMRRLGRIRLQNDPTGEPPISGLGFDPLSDRMPMRTFAGLLAKRSAAIKAVLLDQSLVAGVGNWIADEVLYQARIDPHRRPCDLSADELKRVYDTLRAVVRKAVAVDADKSRFPARWLFHHRWGKNADAVTARGEKIVHVTIGGRTTAYVPTVQH